MSLTTSRYTVVPPIPLKKETAKSDHKEGFFKSTIFPGNESDAKKGHDISIRYFSSGSAEEWISAYIAFMGVCEWKKQDNLFTLARIFLKGDALTKFNSICVEEKITFNCDVEENKKNFDIVTGKLSVLLMPLESLDAQKEYMIYDCRKPGDMTMRAYVARMNELNDYLMHFPPDFSEDQKFSKKQLTDIVKHGMPAKWKIKLSTDTASMARKNITLELLTDFGERQEMQESFFSSAAASKPIPRKVASSYKKEYIPGSLVKKGYAHKPKSESNQKKWCPYHKTDSHSMAECTVVKKLAESAAQSRDSKNGSTAGKFDKKSFQNYMMQQYMEFMENQKPSAMVMEPEEPMMDEYHEGDELDTDPAENGEEIDLDNLSLGEME